MKPVSTFALTALASIAVTLSGCSTISDFSPFETKRVEYKSAQSGPVSYTHLDVYKRQAGTTFVVCGGIAIINGDAASAGDITKPSSGML